MLHTPHGAKLPGPSFARFADYGGWAYAAQAHYSLFENLERGLVHKYHFGDAQEGLQNLWYEHYSINFMAIRGSNVALKVCT